MRRMRFRIFLMTLAAGLPAFATTVIAGHYSIAGVQTTSGRVGRTQNTTGYQLHMGVMPSPCGLSQNAAQKFTIHIGMFDEINPARNAARLWAFYE